MNVEVAVSEGRITGWFNYSPGGPGYDDFRAWMGFLDRQSDEGPAAIASNWPSTIVPAPRSSHRSSTSSARQPPELGGTSAPSG